MKLEYGLYMAEREGRFPQRNKIINNVIKEFTRIYKAGYDPNDYIDEILSQYGLTESDLTSSEIRRINREVEEGCK